MTDLNKERMELELSAGVLDRQIDNLKDEISEGCFDDNMLDELIDLAIKLGEVYAQRDVLEKAKAQAVPDTHLVVPRNREVVVAIEKMVEQQVEASGITSDVFRLDGWRILDAIQEASESGAEG
ncbi:hypothetical protein QWI49_12000 [Acinetobacter nosocomialis]|uniref:hypothetical protein n=1 Tax=Acinetobacter nosocomialis TaxID=106654 RepID=UPI002741785C|nr:hypothetical protein [Acinetobacter nosocomialis]MDP7775870.1 hypothetical protein [Acinetobacter nosocomialis]